VTGHAVVLLAHGSRDPLWRRPIEAVRERIAQQHPGAAVHCAYLELCPPSLPDTLAALAGQGVCSVRIVPMFLGAGRHVRDDLPRMVAQLAEQHGTLALHLQAPIGEDERLIALMAGIASDGIE